MNTAAPDVFAMAEKRLAWIDQRQGVLVQNIANANTPGYLARDITPFSDVLAAEARRVGSGGAPAATSQAKPDRGLAGRSLDGNAVVLDEQLEKIAETDTAHQLSMNLYKKYLSLFKTALGRN
jgi:flagellar basal-body rod protein FlgB